VSETPIQQTVANDNRRSIAYYAVIVSWAVNITLLIAAVAWIFFSGTSVRTIQQVERDLGTVRPPIAFEMDDYARKSTSVTVVELAALIAEGTLIIMLASLFIGGARFRTMRMWLLLTTIGCGWLGIIVAWPEIYWRGQQHRVTAVIQSAEIVAKELQANWPRDDGDTPDLGTFQAYPVGDPTTLVPLRGTTFPDTSQQFTLVDRSADGAIRFRLGGSELGAWLEWRPNDSEPTSFVGGLRTSYSVTRTTRLAPHWFLVRYHKDLLNPRSTPSRFR
jgi:hypothetical protein